MAGVERGSSGSGFDVGVAAVEVVTDAADLVAEGAARAPEGIDDALDEGTLEVGLGAEVVEESGDEVFELFG